MKNVLNRWLQANMTMQMFADHHTISNVFGGQNISVRTPFLHMIISLTPFNSGRIVSSDQFWSRGTFVFLFSMFIEHMEM
ncbi:hypothetical protein EMCRGX_G013981 [Ephydatia muelleri]